RVLNSSPARWLALPTPGEEKLSCPGFDLARATRSFTDFTPNAGDTTRMLGTLAMRLTPAKSFSVSYGSLVNIAAVAAWPADTTSSVYPSGAAVATAFDATMPPALE